VTAQADLLLQKQKPQAGAGLLKPEGGGEPYNASAHDQNVPGHAGWLRVLMAVSPPTAKPPRWGRACQRRRASKIRA
jgi:hypothetical protein